MDIMTRLPRTTKGFDAIAISVETQTQYVRIVPIKKSVNGTQFATIFHDTIFGTTAYTKHLYPTKTRSLGRIYVRNLLYLSVKNQI
jgi:hypothetical protein